MPRKIFFSNYSALQQQQQMSVVKTKVIQTPNKSSKTITATPKKEWNSFTTDLDQFKLSKDEQIKRKQLLLSRNNILNSAEKTVKRMPLTPHSTKRQTTPSSQSDLNSLDIVSNAKNGHSNRKFSNISFNDHHNKENQTPFELSPKPNLVPSAESQFGHNKWQQVVTEPENDRYNRNQNASTFNDERDDDQSYDDLHDDVLHFTKEKLKSANTNTKMKSTPKTKKVQSSVIVTPSSGITTNIDASSKTFKKTKTPASQQHRHDNNDKSSESIAYEEMSANLRGLISELRHYEQLSGRRSCFDPQELELAMEDSEINVRTVMRCLVQLVCQSMTYLLQNEVQLSSMKQINDKLMSEIDCLKVLIQSNPATNSIKAPIPDNDVARIDEKASSQSQRILSRTMRYPVPSHRTTATAIVEEVGQDNSVGDKSYRSHSTSPSSYVNELTAAVTEFLVMTPSSANKSEHTQMNNAAVTNDSSSAGTRYGASTSDWLFNHPAVQAQQQQQQQQQQAVPPPAKSLPQQSSITMTQVPVYGMQQLVQPSAEFDTIHPSKLHLTNATSIHHKSCSPNNNLYSNRMSIGIRAPIATTQKPLATAASPCPPSRFTASDAAKSDEFNSKINNAYTAFYDLSSTISANTVPIPPPQLKPSPARRQLDMEQESGSMINPREFSPSPYNRYSNMES